MAWFVVAMLALSAGKAFTGPVLFGPDELVVVGSGHKNISAFWLNMTSGALVPIGEVAQVAEPSFLAASPDRMKLYSPERLKGGVAEPLFRISLFRIRAFAAGNIASMMLAMGRGGMQFMLIIWLQGIWLPLHGYGYSQTPLSAGIYLVPLTTGFLLAAPLSGVLSDKFGPRPFTVGGALLTGASFLLLIFVPVDFAYWEFAIVIALNGSAPACSSRRTGRR